MDCAGHWQHLQSSNFQFGIEVRNAACNQRFLEGKAVVQITAIEITIDHLLDITELVFGPERPCTNRITFAAQKP
jgi:hypothetical protein